MATTCNTVIQRAQSFNALNSGLTNDPAEMLSRIRADQQALFTSVAGLTRDYFQTTASLTSTSGSSARSFDLSVIAPPVERVLILTLGDGRTASQVDVLDTDAELSPRYIVRGQKLVEVSNDWGASGAITATLTYVYGMTDIDPTGSLTQTVTIPDQWIDLLVLPLAVYLSQKDPGRDPAEVPSLKAMLDDRQQAFVAYLTQFGGIESRRLIIPSPVQATKKQ